MKLTNCKKLTSLFEEFDWDRAQKFENYFLMKIEDLIKLLYCLERE